MTTPDADMRPASSWPAVLVVHNQFQHVGGEDFTAFAEVDLMRSRGARVHMLVYDSGDPQRIDRVKRRPDELVFNRAVYTDVRRLIRQHAIDIVHCHNLWPLVGPSAYRAAKAEGVAVVQTMHDFRMGCLQGQLLRQGKICERCRPGRHLAGMAFGCYRGSRVQSIALGLAQTVNAASGAWSLPTLFIAPSQFVRDRMSGWGISAERTVVKPHFVPEDPGPMSPERDIAVYVGRLSIEKGLQAVVAAWRVDDVPLVIVGDGPLRPDLEHQARVQGKTNIRFVGYKSPAEVGAFLRRACFLILPSITHETFGRVLIEAYAHGVPVVATRLGATPEIVQEGVTGLLFDPHDPADLRAKLDQLARHSDQSRPLRQSARRAYEERYSAATNADLLASAYRGALSHHRAVARH